MLFLTATLVLPPPSPHSSFYSAFSLLCELCPFDREELFSRGGREKGGGGGHVTMYGCMWA